MNILKKLLFDKLSKEVLVNSDDSLRRFFDISILALHEHAPRKKRYSRAYQMPCLTKDFSKVIVEDYAIIFSKIRLTKKIGFYM